MAAARRVAPAQEHPAFTAARAAAGSPTEFQGRAANTDGAVRYTAPSLVFDGPDGQGLEAGGFQPIEAYDVVIANLDPTLERQPPADDPVAALSAFPYALATARCGRWHGIVRLSHKHARERRPAPGLERVRRPAEAPARPPDSATCPWNDSRLSLARERRRLLATRLGSGSSSAAGASQTTIHTPARRAKEKPRAASPSLVDDDPGVAYDEDLANRIRELIASEPDVSEQTMFGGLVFLVGGRLSVAAGGQGSLVVRVDPEETDVLLAKPHAQPFEMGGREMQGRLRIDAEGERTKRQLEPWVRRAVAYARTLPSKR
jgi:TfoX N-terminal domain